MRFTVLGFMGESGSGKDFCGRWVVENKNFCRTAFADPLKRFCGQVFEYTEEQLWGDAELRNMEIELDWSRSEKNALLHVDDWVRSLDLTPEEMAQYKGVALRWFEECSRRANGKKLSCRVALQLLGTEYGRSFRDDLWVSTLFGQVIPYIRDGFGYDKVAGVLGNKARHPGAVITDFRFKNELAAGKENGAYAIKLIRISQEGKKNEAEEAGISGHASEAEQRSIPDEEYSLVLRMKDGAENVYSRLEEMFEKQEWL